MPTKPKPHNHHQRKINQQAYERLRGTAQQRGYTKAWSKYSKERLKQHPLCVMCKAAGKIVKADLTDHIKPARYFPELFNDPSNHQSLCVTHNASKAADDAIRYAKYPVGGG